MTHNEYLEKKCHKPKKKQYQIRTKNTAIKGG